MTIEYRTVRTKEPARKTCDRCARVAEARGADYEWAEFMHLDHLGGYGSLFGDGARVAVDLCQHCVRELLAPYLRITPRKYSLSMSERKERRRVLARVLRRATALFEGDRAAARQWLRTPAKALGGKTPRECLETEADAEAVLDLIGRLEHGVIP